MKKLLVLLAVISASVMMSSCKTGQYIAGQVMNYAQKAAEQAKEQAKIPDNVDEAKAKGVEQGKMICIVYTKIAEKQDEQFNRNVANVWKEVNKIESFNAVPVIAPKLNALISKVVAQKNFSDLTQEIAIKVASNAIQQVLTQIQTKTLEKIEEKYLYWLWGIREGVNIQLQVQAKAAAENAAKNENQAKMVNDTTGKSAATSSAAAKTTQATVKPDQEKK